MTPQFQEHVARTLAEIRATGLFKTERPLESPQSNRIASGGREGVLNFCANNYLGLADHPVVRAAARDALDRWGYGLASVRFICGTQSIHLELERRLARFLGTEDCILYPSCFDANGGLFETLLGPDDAVISDELNHASIIDGIRLCKAKRFRYRHNDMTDLAAQLAAADAAGARFKLITTDGAFSMDGTIAQLDAIAGLAARHGALTHIDECHATGFLGKTGRGTHEFRGVFGTIDLITGTLGKALGGASGGFTAGSRDVVSLLRQRSRPYLFSNSVAPAVVAGAIAALDLLEGSTELRDRLELKTRFWREGAARIGLSIKPGEHPIVPVMLGEATLAQRMAAALFERGVYVVGFFFPVVPQGQARIRTQVSAAHTTDDLEFALAMFADAKKSLGL